MALILLLITCCVWPVYNDEDSGEYQQENTIWATLDGVKSMLIYSPPEDSWEKATHVTYIREHIPMVPVYNKKFWTNIRDGDLIGARNQKTLAVNKLLYKDFPKHLFYHFYELTEVNIIKQGLKSISSDDFSNAYLLKTLNLSYNLVEKLESFVFHSAKQLETIDLSFNQISHIEHDAFGSSVKYLYLQNNPIVVWDVTEEPIPCTKIQFYNLYISDNLIGNISELFNPDECIISDNIDMTNTNISSVYIHSKMSTLKARQNLINQIVLLNNSETYQLHDLDLSYNEITSIKNITNLIKLEKLDLAHNLIEAFDNETFANMNNLRELRFGSNLLKNLDLEFLVQTQRLVFLDLSYNSLQTFKLTYLAGNLEELHIEGNNLTVMDTNMKRMAPKLIRIGLNDNNWDCGRLTTDLLLIQFDDVFPVVNETISSLMPTEENNVKGIGCTMNDAKQTDGNSMQTPVISGIVLAYIDRQIEGLQKQIDENLEKLSSKLDEVNSRVDDLRRYYG